MPFTVIKNHYSLLLILAGMACSLPAFAQEISVRTEVNPSVVMVGERAEYTLRFVNTTQIPNMATPRVDGLAFSGGMNTSSFRQIINGVVTVETRASWSFSPTRIGSFTIPGRTTRINGQDVVIPAVAFEAVPMDEATKSRALLQLELPDGPVYVGQAIPAKLGLFVRDDLTLSNIAFPERDGEGFLNTEFDENPMRTRTRIDGRRYEAFVWEFILTPIKSGPTQLRFTQNIAIQGARTDNRFPSMFNLGRTKTEPLSLFTEALDLDVLPLPAENRPDSFSDALGQFQMTSTLSTETLVVGEPMTLTLVLSGSGNFERIAPPQIPAWENWRLYPPKMDFTAEDKLNLNGAKSFEYILIPQSVDITEVPEIEYAFFNPETADYQTILIEARDVTVAPSSKPVDPDLFVSSINAGEETTEAIPEALLPIRPGTGKLLPLEPKWKSTTFWMLNGGWGAALLASALVLLKRKQLRNDNQLARRQVGNREIRKHLRHARKAADSGDSQAFFHAARSALQERVSHLSKTAAEANTLVTSDCLDILKSSDLPDHITERCSTLLQHADAHQFAGIPVTATDLPPLADDLNILITDLNRLQK